MAQTIPLIVHCLQGSEMGPLALQKSTQSAAQLLWQTQSPIAFMRLTSIPAHTVEGSAPSENNVLHTTQGGSPELLVVAALVTEAATMAPPTPLLPCAVPPVPVAPPCALPPACVPSTTTLPPHAASITARKARALRFTDTPLA
jgi:hypothetical protein